MYIYKIIIHNFRNFKNFMWKPDKKVNVLFGHNGCGKTNLAAAINMVFSAKIYDNYFDKYDYYLGNEELPIKIQVWLSDIDTVPFSSSTVIQHLDENDNCISDDDVNVSKSVIIFELNSTIEREKEWSFWLNTGSQACRKSDRQKVKFSFIDAERNPTKEISFNTTSLLYKYASSYIGDEISHLSKDILQDSLKKISNSSKIGSLLKSLNGIYSKTDIDELGITLKNLSSSWNSSSFDLGINLGDDIMSFSRLSRGTQCLFLLVLANQNLDNSAILFIEELEQNLEPKNQKYITDIYRKSDYGQLFITSHSSEIISSFDYNQIFVLGQTEAKSLFSSIDNSIHKEICRANKKDFINALMASAIIIVEGQSEHTAFPIFSFHNWGLFGIYDIELLLAEGKGNLKKYCQAMKALDKKVYVLTDNDDDSGSLICDLSKLSDEVIITINSYEDLIFRYIKNCANKLNDILDFNVVNNKLRSIYQKEKALCSRKESALQDYMKNEDADPSNYNSYDKLTSHPILFKYILHDSFTTPYYARLLAELIISENESIEFFNSLMNHFAGQKLVNYNDYLNVYCLKDTIQ